jgi:hypothetical protein
MCQSYLEVEEPEGDVLNDLLGNILRVEFGSELKLQLSLFLDVLQINYIIIFMLDNLENENMSGWRLNEDRTLIRQ